MSTIYRAGHRNPVFTAKPRDFGVAHAFATIVDSGDDGEFLIAPIGFEPVSEDWTEESAIEAMSCLGCWLVVTIQGGRIHSMWPMTFRDIADNVEWMNIEPFGGFVDEAGEVAA